MAALRFPPWGSVAGKLLFPGTRRSGNAAKANRVPKPRRPRVALRYRRQLRASTRRPSGSHSLRIRMWRNGTMDGAVSGWGGGARGWRLGLAHVSAGTPSGGELPAPPPHARAFFRRSGYGDGAAAAGEPAPSVSDHGAGRLQVRSAAAALIGPPHPGRARTRLQEGIRFPLRRHSAEASGARGSCFGTECRSRRRGRRGRGQ